MTPVISVGSLKTAGSSTLALTLAGVAAAAEIPVVLIDAARDKDLVEWARKPGVPRGLTVQAARGELELESLVRAARRRGEFCVIDAGDDAEMIRAGARLSDRALIPVRFSPLSAYAALATDRLLATEAAKGRRGRDWLFAASAVTAIPSRVARSIEAMIDRSVTPRLAVGLVQRPAYEAPFLAGGTLFTVSEDLAPGLDRARAEAATLAYEVGLLGRETQAGDPVRVHAPALAA